MIMQHISADQYIVSRWSGGITRQIAIAPAGAAYGERSFLWRVSSATVDLDASVFTPLPDYHRWITTLEGSITLTHDGGAPVHLAPYDMHQFDGGSVTCSQGQCTDFNLMLRKGMCRGSLRVLRLSRAGRRAVYAASHARAASRTLLIFCCIGGGELAAGDSRAALRAAETILMEDPPETPVQLTAYDPSIFLIAEIEAGAGGT